MPDMRITMTENCPGSPHGWDVISYEKGKSYDVPEDLGKAFISEKVAFEGDPKPTAGKGATVAAKD